MGKYRIILPFFLTFFFFSNYSIAYNLRQISNNDGLSNSAILSICQDIDGFMWFGSCDGLNLFNGLNIQVYKPTNKDNNLSGNLIENIIETDKGVLWIHTNYGLNRFNKILQKIDTYEEFKGRYLIEKSRDNDIFIIKEDNCIYYYHEKDNVFKKIIINGLDYNNILDFVITGNNTIRIFTRDGNNPCFSISKNEKADIHLSVIKADKHSSKLLYTFHEREPVGIVYLIDDTYTLYEYDIEGRRKHYVCNLQKEIMSKGEVSSIIKYHDNYFVGFKTNGLLKLKYVPEKQNSYEIESINVKSGIFCLLKDRYQDLIWIGTDGQGVYMYSNDMYSIRSTMFNTFIGGIEKPARSLFLDKEQTLWIGTKGDGIIRIKNYQFEQEPSQFITDRLTSANTPLVDNSIYAFASSSRDILWIGCEDGLNYYSYKDKTIKKVNLAVDGIPVKYIHSICELGDSTLWIATVGTGIIKATLSGAKDVPVFTDVERMIVHDGSDFYNYFFTIYKEDNSTLWFGNRGYGAYYMRLGDKSLNNLSFDEQWNNQTVNDIYSMAKDSDGNLWFGTSFGLLKYPSSRQTKLFNERNGFPNNTIHGILTDSQQNLWLSTNRGIVRFNTVQENFHTYNQLNGLQVIEFSDGASFKDDKSGILLFGGINGFVAISETGFVQKEYQPQIHFDNLVVFGEEKNIFDYVRKDHGADVLELSYNQNFFSISFTALDYINGNNYNYYYKLDDLSKQWIDNGSSNKASFTSLAPGEYILHIKYRNTLTGNESPVRSLIIKICPPWYLSIWAQIVYIILSVIIIVFVIRAIRERNARRKHIALEKLRTQHEEELHESKLRFFTNIAHEFCTPLTLIYGPCSRILTHDGTDKFVRSYTELIQRNAERLNDLIQELIEFRRIETGNKLPQIEELFITELLNNISGSFNDLSDSKNIQYTKEIRDSIYWNSDRNFIYTIVSNLISNAFKYTNVNGRVLVTASVEYDELLITVSNTGKGIEKENLNRVFDRYSILDNFENQGVKSPVSRNGLGLAISYNMVKLLDGTIEVNSVLDEVTEFIVRLPQKEITLTDEKMRALPDISIRKDYEVAIDLPKYEYDKTKPTVLIIDDDIEILWFICDIFSEEYNVMPVNRAIEVEDVLLKTHPDIIISDVMMPGIDGIELARNIKGNKKLAHIPLILISAKHTVEEQMEGLAAGAEMYIAKPFNTDYLRTSVRHLISRKETLKDYFSSPLSAFNLKEGKLTHKENTKFVQDILDVIDKNIMNQKLSAQFIASELNMSPRHLYRRMSEIDGEQSPADMIRESRLHIAKNLLVNTKMTIDEIIYKSGFSNRATFFRAFANKYKCTPREYRERQL